MTEAVGVAEVVAALSVTSDLTRGHPPGEAMRATLLAAHLAARLGFDGVRRGDVYWGTLLRYAGCTASSHEIAVSLGGDDVGVRARGDLLDPTRPAEVVRFVATLLGSAEPGTRLHVLSNLPRIAAVKSEGVRADCEVGAELVRRVGLPQQVADAVRDAFERWDGKGSPRRLRGEQIADSARIGAVAFVAVMFDAVGGKDLARHAVTRWSGRALDPDIAGAFLTACDEMLATSDVPDLWASIVAAEPGPRRTFTSDDALDEALAAFGDACDLKTPWFTGHSRGVAALARTAGGVLGMHDTRDLFRAALVHDIGRSAVPVRVWERTGPLTRDDWELVRMHPYSTERVLQAAPVLAPLARIARRHHERTDGSGYPAGLSDPGLDPAAAVLAVADVVHALGEARPHRGALSSHAVATTVAALPLDPIAVRAVLEAAGAPAPALRELPAGLTEREVEVLRMLVAGNSERAVATRLGVAPSTVHTHTRHIYGKCDVTTRAGLAMFAMRSGLAHRGIP